ncbi:hypothetical protein EIN_054890 [Entamoeba invadens IP1]|uniref:hypothetical protein n=1 Tax=Entamoeba invadens IP1 TaxID=370355 RepID=UPI0002C3E445|nr:hypothetical protein EIN_054890 [Entamoeba invadens IP1]ELP93194.1 hypothetical protein EIN_054890 [Entamoeba invadens IP1]|eukprot:XP_004259965.1 hypothetical protein EIN_054890 [Entamoeba invadens IP1]
MEEDYREMIRSIDELTPSIHAALLANQNPHTLDCFVDQLTAIRLKPIPVVSSTSLVHCYRTIFTFWKEMNKSLAYGYSKQSTTVVMYVIVMCVSYEPIRSVSVILSKTKSQQLMQTFMTYKTFCMDTFMCLTRLLTSIQTSQKSFKALPLTFTVLYGELLTSLSHSLPSLRLSLHSDIIDNVTQMSFGTPEYRVSSPMLETDKLVKNDSCYVQDDVHLSELHYSPFHSRGQFVACVLRSSILFVSERKIGELEDSVPFQEFVDEFLRWRTLCWKSFEWKDLTFFMAEDALIRKMPLEFNKMLSIYSKNTNLFDIEKVVFISEYLKKSLSALSKFHRMFFIEERVDIQSVVNIIHIIIRTDNAEALINVVNMLIEILPYLNGAQRKVVTYDFILEQHFRYFFMHWCSYVRDAFHVLLLYRMTLGRCTKLDNLHEEEKKLYESRNRPDFVALDFDKIVVRRMLERIELMRDICKALYVHDKNYIMMSGSLARFDLRKKEYDTWAKRYSKSNIPIISLAKPNAL